MGAAFSAALGNVDVLITASGAQWPILRGIFRTVRETDLLDIETMGVEGVKFTLAIDATLIECLRQGDTVEIITSDDGKHVGECFTIAGHIDDGRAMKRLLLHEGC